jgi:hypothetical protein
MHLCQTSHVETITNRVVKGFTISTELTKFHEHSITRFARACKGGINDVIRSSLNREYRTQSAQSSLILRRQSHCLLVHPSGPNAICDRLQQLTRRPARRLRGPRRLGPLDPRRKPRARRITRLIPRLHVTRCIAGAGCRSRPSVCHNKLPAYRPSVGPSFPSRAARHYLPRSSPSSVTATRALEAGHERSPALCTHAHAFVHAGDPGGRQAALLCTSCRRTTHDYWRN